MFTRISWESIADAPEIVVPGTSDPIPGRPSGFETIFRITTDQQRPATPPSNAHPSSPPSPWADGATQVFTGPNQYLWASGKFWTETSWGTPQIIARTDSNGRVFRKYGWSVIRWIGAIDRYFINTQDLISNSGVVSGLLFGISDGDQMKIRVRLRNTSGASGWSNSLDYNWDSDD